MRIDKTQIIAGFSAIIVRDFLMKVMDRLFTGDDVVRHFKTNKSDATTIIEELLKIEYVEPVEIRKHQLWSVTAAGRTLALASAAKPILRKTADKKIAELLERVATINSSNQYVYAVTKVVVFGSYLSEQERINDVDIAIALEKKATSDDHFIEMCERSIQKAQESGRRFSTQIEMICWPQQEVNLFLKSRSKAISLHSLHDEVLRSAKQKVIFEKS